MLHSLTKDGSAQGLTYLRRNSVSKNEHTSWLILLDHYMVNN